MNTTSSGAVGFAPVGTFVKDLAQELGKSASTVAAYIKKHLPEALVKRKNANNRLANFALVEAVEAVRAHYVPTADNSLQLEIERLRDENKRLRALLTTDENATVEEIEQTVANLLQSCESDYDVEAAAERQKQTIERVDKMLERMNARTANIWRETNEKRTNAANSSPTQTKPRVRKAKQTVGTDGRPNFTIV